MVWHPEQHGSTLILGRIGWKAAAFGEPTASTGRRLSRALVRSLRRRATVPLYAVSGQGGQRGNAPSAWGTELAVGQGIELREFPDGLVTFER